MEFNISVIDVLKILVVLVLLSAFFIPVKKGYTYNSLDKKGVISNIVLSVLYVPLSCLGFTTIFFSDAPLDNYSKLRNLLLGYVIFIGISIPILSIASILISVIARKRGKSKFSFIIQFLPLALFAVMLVLIFFMLNA